MINREGTEDTIQATIQPRRKTSLGPERRIARNWYWWLWLSPLLTMPTLLFLFLAFAYAGQDHVGGSIAVLGSALWHLVLLIPALNKRSEFVRWHGRQALLLAGAMTVLLLVFAFDSGAIPLYGTADDLLYFAFAVWFFGTLVSQRQAARGDCSLMRCLGRAEALPGPAAGSGPGQEAK
jgi:uncharacterized membrane protein